MYAEILSLGNEVISGQILDTNSQWLSQRLEELGIRVLYHTTVGDDLAAMTDAFYRALGRADVVVSTGGLGPTPADMTRQSIAQAAGRPLRLDKAALEHIRQLFARRKRPMPADNERQAFIPEGGDIVPNLNGTAPGIDLVVPGEGGRSSRLFALPGVPAEMKELWRETVGPALRALAGQATILHRRIKCFGMGESHIAERLTDLIHKTENPRVGITASQTVILLRLAATGPTEEACQAILEPVVALIRKRLGTVVFGEDDEELEHAVVKLLREQGQTLATVEWGTTGLVAQRLGGVSGASGVYRGGVVTPGGAAWVRAPFLPADLLDLDATAGQEMIAAMAEGCRKLFEADLALAVGPFPEFDPAAAEPKHVMLALSGAHGITEKSIPFAGHPAYLKTYCANQALDFVRLRIMDVPF